MLLKKWQAEVLDQYIQEQKATQDAANKLQNAMQAVAKKAIENAAKQAMENAAKKHHEDGVKKLRQAVDAPVFVPGVVRMKAAVNAEPFVPMNQ